MAFLIAGYLQRISPRLSVRQDTDASCFGNWLPNYKDGAYFAPNVLEKSVETVSLDEQLIGLTSVYSHSPNYSLDLESTNTY